MAKSHNLIYPYKRIANQKPLKALELVPFMATDGEVLYYKGELVEGADIATLQKIGGSTSYFSDKKHVYYEGKALSLSNREKLKLVAREQGEPFLYDAEEGKVFIGAFMFDKEKGPYKVLGKGGNHLYHLLFTSKSGVYFYNDETEEQERIKDNPFVGKLEQITPDVFADEENIYYFGASEKRKRRIKALISTTTSVYLFR